MKTREEVMQILKKSNPDEGLAILVMFSDAFMQYIEASENIREHGSVVIHPRTGAPISNPFLPIQKEARAALQSMKRVDSEKLWT